MCERNRTEPAEREFDAIEELVCKGLSKSRSSDCCSATQKRQVTCRAVSSPLRVKPKFESRITFKTQNCHDESNQHNDGNQRENASHNIEAYSPAFARAA